MYKLIAEGKHNIYIKTKEIKTYGKVTDSRFKFDEDVSKFCQYSERLYHKLKLVIKMGIDYVNNLVIIHF